MKGKLSNSEIEDRAIKFVMNECKNVEDVRKRKLGYDLKIGNKMIEVKGTGSSKAPLQRIFLSGNDEHKALNKYKNRYWIYRVIVEGKSCQLFKKIPAKDIEKLIREPRWRVKVKKTNKVKEASDIID